MKIWLVEPTPERLMNLVAYAPLEQHLEAERYTGSDLGTAVEDMVDSSDELYILESEDKLVMGLTGYTKPSALSDTAHPFLLSTVHRHKRLRDWLKCTRMINDYYLEKHSTLIADIDAQYGEAVRWMKWLGYELNGPHPMGPEDSPFYRCVFRRD